LGADHLFQSRQSIQNPARIIDRKRTSSLLHASHSLPVVGIGSKERFEGRISVDKLMG
jgi:hypothetical protein